MGDKISVFANNYLSRLLNHQELLNSTVTVGTPTRHTHVDIDKIELILLACKIKFSIKDGSENDVMRNVICGTLKTYLKCLRQINANHSPYVKTDEETIQYYLYIKNNQNLFKRMDTEIKVVSTY